MQFFRALKVGQRIGLGFVALLMVAAAIAAVGFFSLTELTQELRLLTSDRMVKVDLARNIRDNLAAIQVRVRNLALSDDPRQAEQERLQIARHRESNGQILQQLNGIVHSVEGRKLLEATQSARQQFNGEIDRVLVVVGSGNRDKALQTVLAGLTRAQEDYVAALDGLIAFQKRLMNEAVKDAESTARWSEILMVTMGLLAAAAAGLIGWLVTRSVTRPLGGEPAALRAMATAIASGDLTRSIDASGSGQGSVVAAMVAMQSSLRDIVSQVRVNSAGIAAGSTQIASGNADLSQRTESQAASLQETAASMSQLTQTVQGNAEVANQAQQRAAQASEAASEGGERVSRVISTMQDIATSSRRIGDIIGTIDSIAFQTNILALNAAVEAARAGEQGRGFAVVASEVRALAQRTTGAAREIKQLIETSVSKVEQGAHQVEEAGAAMRMIVDQVHDVSSLITDISTASIQQSQGIIQINAAVAELDQATQRNAALVEEHAAAAQDLREQAQKLDQAVSVFQLQSGSMALAMR